MNDVRVNDLIDRYFDCDLVGDDRASLERTLLASAQARELFWAKAETHALLRKWGRTHWGRVAAANGHDGTSSLRHPLSPWSSLSRLGSIPGKGLAAAAVLIMVVATGATILRWQPFLDRRAAAPRAIEPALETSTFAVLTAAFQPVWADANVGLILQRGSLPTGPIELLSGRVELLFGSGGTAIIEGPATVEPIARDALRLTRGYVRCRCPEAGTELRVETPSSAITDLGTEFAVSVDETDRTRVGVIEGKVRVDIAETSRFVTTGDALTIKADGTSTEDIGFWKDFSSKALLIPFNEAAFAAGSNVLKAASFDGLADAAISGNATQFLPGPWLGTTGYVEVVNQSAMSPPHAVRIHAHGSPFWPLVSQQIDTGDIAGKTIMGCVHVMRTLADPLVDPQRVLLKFNFLDAAGREFASAERHFLRGPGPNDRFVEGRLAAEAPPGTVGVRFQVLLNAAGRLTGSIIVDDATMVIVD